MHAIFFDVMSSARLVGADIIVRPYCSEDALSLWKIVDSEKALMADLPWLVETTEDARASYMRHLVASTWVGGRTAHFGIFETGSGVTVGGIELHDIDWTLPSFVVGYWLAPSARGRGLATQAVRLVTKFALEQLGAVRVAIDPPATNSQSIAVARRSGFCLEGILKNHKRDAQGLLFDTFLFATTQPMHAVEE